MIYDHFSETEHNRINKDEFCYSVKENFPLEKL